MVFLAMKRLGFFVIALAIAGALGRFFREIGRIIDDNDWLTKRRHR